MSYLFSMSPRLMPRTECYSILTARHEVERKCPPSLFYSYGGSAVANFKRRRKHKSFGRSEPPHQLPQSKQKAIGVGVKFGQTTYVTTFRKLCPHLIPAILCNC